MNQIPDHIGIGKRIEILRLNDEDSIFSSQILDIIGDKEFIISGPIKNNQLIFIHKDQEIKIYFMVEDKGKYSFIAKVISREHLPIYTLKIQRISIINKTQQRDHFRLWTTLKVIKKHRISNGQIDDECIEECEARDISGGGMRLYSNTKHNIGDMLDCNININDSMIETKAMVKRIEEIDTFDYKYGLGLSFIEIEETKRDAIIAYIFERQRILREKGLI